MKLQHLIFDLCLLLFVGNLFGQSSRTEKVFFPFLDKESQSNVIVIICDLGGRGQLCPPEYTNALSNTKLFTMEEQKLIKEVFVKYKNVTTNSGPPGTIFTSLYKTNLVTYAMNRTFEIESIAADFQYTNFDANERIRIGAGMLAEFRNKSNNGYDVSLTRTGGGTLLSFGEIKNNLPNGLFARFADIHAQGLTWDYKLANFSDSHLVEYRQYTNGMVLGKLFMWNPQNNNLILEADFKEPYDWNKNRL